MIYGEYVTIPGLVAGASLTAKQYTPVMLSSTAARTVLSHVATTRVCVGILMNDPASGEVAEVAALGVAKCVAGTATLTRGASLSSNSTGAVPATAGKIWGIAIDAAVTKGDLISVLLVGPSIY
jgi:hypothetical protein